MININLDKEKNKPSFLSIEERISSFNEICLGFDEEKALSEANRCLNCLNAPCKNGCPLNNNIPEFIQMVKNKDYESAFEIIKQKSNFPAICSRVCAQEKQCESKCTRGLNGDPVSIGMLERFVTDWHYTNVFNNDNKNNSTSDDNINKKIAIIGGGVSGLACAEDLTNLGYDVTIFESLDVIGGIAYYAIPDFRLPREIVTREIDRVVSKGTKINTNITAGQDFSLQDLLKNYDAVYISSGADYPKTMGIDGENLNEVLYANEFLKECKLNNNDYKNGLMKGKTVAVVGGGNVAMDTARTLIRLGAKKVYILYRRSIEEMPARKEELEDAKNEGVEILYLTNPTAILTNLNNAEQIENYANAQNNCVNGVKCVKMRLGEPDEKGRRKPIEIENSEFIIHIDSIIMAISSTTTQEIKNFAGDILLNKYGLIDTKENTETKIKKVYAGGDVVTGPNTIVSAIEFGKKSAITIHEFFCSKSN